MMVLQQQSPSCSDETTRPKRNMMTSRSYLTLLISILGRECYSNAFTCENQLHKTHASCPTPLGKIPKIHRRHTKNLPSLHVGLQDGKEVHATSTSASCVELIEPETGCEVVLLGCFHGTVSSAKDVEYLINESETDVVALELCATRFADLRREEESQQQQQQQIPGDSDSTLYGNGDQESSPWLSRYLRMVSRTIEKKGLSTGLAAAVLGGVSGLQTALSGFTPGLEFTTALQCSSEQENGASDIVLADRDVDETLRRLGKLPQVTADMIFKDPIRSIPKYSSVLKRALFGEDKLLPSHQVQLSKVLTRNVDAMRDLARLTIPPLILIQGVTYLLTSSLLPLQGSDPISSSMDDILSPVSQLADSTVTPTTVDAIFTLLLDAIPHLIASGSVIFSTFVLIVLPTVRVVLDERDDILGEGIMAACKLAASKQPSQEQDSDSIESKPPRPGRVVAVLGLLHVNGVARRLLLPTAKDTGEGDMKGTIGR